MFVRIFHDFIKFYLNLRDDLGTERCTFTSILDSEESLMCRWGSEAKI